MRKKLAFLLTTIIIFAVFISPVCAVDDSSSSGQTAISEPEVSTASYSYITSAHSSLTINSGTASIYNSFSCVSSVDKIVISCYLQRYDNGWKTVKSWRKTSTSSYTTSSYAYSVSSGYTYRVKSYFYAYDGNSLVESTTRTDSEYY